MDTKQITTQLLETIYTRAMQYCHAKYGSQPGTLHITNDGMLTGVWGKSCMGEYYEEEEYFGAECLSEDLDAVYAQRMQHEAEKRKEREAENERNKKLQEQRELEERKKKYFELKKEFEP